MITGDGEIKQVTGEGLQDWSVRIETNGSRTLVLRPRTPATDTNSLQFLVAAEQDLKRLPAEITPLMLSSPRRPLLSGYLAVESAPELRAEPDKISGLVEIEPSFLPSTMPMRREHKPGETRPLAYRLAGSPVSLTLKIDFADPEARLVSLRNFLLEGQFGEDGAAFTLSATARVKDPSGGAIELLSGGVAISSLEPSPDWRLRYDQGRFLMHFERAGEFPVRLKFNAKVQQSADGDRNWNRLDFVVAPSALQPLLLKGLPAETQFDFPGAARPERQGDDFRTYLPADGSVKMAWKRARPRVGRETFLRRGDAFAD